MNLSSNEWQWDGELNRDYQHNDDVREDIVGTPSYTRGCKGGGLASAMEESGRTITKRENRFGRFPIADIGRCILARATSKGNKTSEDIDDQENGGKAKK